ncbi:MAG: hypothetical protein HFJ52_00205 [Clostridia bacterium]|nr:hypothetical protein [Clostridia bacterium]
MIKKKLEQYQSVQKEIADLEGRINKAQKKSNIVSDTVQSSKGFPYVKHSVRNNWSKYKKISVIRQIRNKVRRF